MFMSLRISSVVLHCICNAIIVNVNIYRLPTVYCEAKLRKGALASSLLKRVTFIYLGFVFTFSLFTFSISRTHGTENEKEQPDWRKYRLPLEK